MKDGTTSILVGIQKQIDSWRLVTYLLLRNKYRAKLAIPRSALTAQIYDVHKLSLPQASHKTKLIWDKHWHIFNQAKDAHIAADSN